MQSSWLCVCLTPINANRPPFQSAYEPISIVQAAICAFYEIKSLTIADDTNPSPDINAPGSFML